jgi:hypothetical protein
MNAGDRSALLKELFSLDNNGLGISVLRLSLGNVEL